MLHESDAGRNKSYAQKRYTELLEGNDSSGLSVVPTGVVCSQAKSLPQLRLLCHLRHLYHQCINKSERFISRNDLRPSMRAGSYRIEHRFFREEISVRIFGYWQKFTYPVRLGDNPVRIFIIILTSVADHHLRFPLASSLKRETTYAYASRKACRQRHRRRPKPRGGMHRGSVTRQQSE